MIIKKLNKKLTEIARISLTSSIHDNDLTLESDAEDIFFKRLNNLKNFECK